MSDRSKDSWDGASVVYGPDGDSGSGGSDMGGGTGGGGTGGGTGGGSSTSSISGTRGSSAATGGGSGGISGDGGDDDHSDDSHADGGSGGGDTGHSGTDSETDGGTGGGSGGGGDTCDEPGITVNGGADDDVILGTNGNDTLSGGGGNDTIVAGGGNDIVNGDDGDDVLFGDGDTEAVNMIQNGSFEDLTGLTPTTYGYLGTGGVNGWTTGNPLDQVDIHGDSRGGVAPADGNYWADLEQTPGNITLGQDVAGVNDGELYHLSFSAGDRLTDDNTFKVLWNGEVVDIKGAEILDPVNGDMQQYNITLTGGSGDGSNRIEFMGLGGDNRRGVSIDDVKMVSVADGHCDGNDTIHAGAGDDIVYAGAGADTVYGGNGDDVIYGDNNDTPGGGSGGDGTGDSSGGGDGSGDSHSGDGDTVGGTGGGSGGGGHAGTDPDACDLTEGVGANGDTIYGGGGNDTINGMSGHDYLSGGNGDDTISGGTGNDKILGDGGNDTLDGGEGDDCIDGGTGDDVIHTGLGSDHVQGGDDQDVIYGNGGDVVDGGSGGNDFDTLVVNDVDHIEYTSGDHEDGVVHFNDGNTLEFEEIENVVPCFTPGTIVLTSKGEIKVEDLKAGDKVVTRDNGLQEIRWIGTKLLTGRALLESPHLRPVLIRKGALGNGLPERDMMVSPNHRMLVANDRTTLLFEEREVLVAAKHLVNNKSVQQVDTVGTSYIHFMFDNHEVVLGDGTWTESFQPGDYSLKGIGNSQRNEIFELFPELRESHGRKGYIAARRSLKRKEARLLQ